MTKPVVQTSENENMSKTEWQNIDSWATMDVDQRWTLGRWINMAKISLWKSLYKKKQAVEFLRDEMQRDFT